MADRNNTIAGWALAAGIAALGSSILFGKIIHSETPGEGKQGYVIQGVESGEAAVLPKFLWRRCLPLQILPRARLFLPSARRATRSIRAVRTALVRISGPQWASRMAMFQALPIQTR